MDDQVYARVKASSLKNYKHKNVCLIGRVETCSNDIVYLDCTDQKVRVNLSKNLSSSEIKQGEYIEARGQPISDDFLMATDYNKIGSDFDLVLYNKTLDLLVPKINCYS